MNFSRSSRWLSRSSGQDGQDGWSSLLCCDCCAVLCLLPAFSRFIWAPLTASYVCGQSFPCSFNVRNDDPEQQGMHSNNNLHFLPHLYPHAPPCTGVVAFGDPMKWASPDIEMQAIWACSLLRDISICDSCAFSNSNCTQSVAPSLDMPTVTDCRGPPSRQDSKSTSRRLMK